MSYGVAGSTALGAEERRSYRQMARKDKGPATTPSHTGPQQEPQTLKANELFASKSGLLGPLHGQRAQLH